MAYEKMTVKREYKKYKDCKEGDVLCEGNFLGEGIDRFKKRFFEFRDPAKDVIHVLNSSGHVCDLIDKYVEPGDWCKFTYLGTFKLTRGDHAGSDSHQFDLDIDPERRMHVKASNAPTADTEDTTPPTPSAAGVKDMVL